MGVRSCWRLGDGVDFLDEPGEVAVDFTERLAEEHLELPDIIDGVCELCRIHEMLEQWDASLNVNSEA